MTHIDLYNVLIAPRITEKGHILAEKLEQVVFKVARNSTKDQIKAAFELIFDAKVACVRTTNVQGKKKKFRGFKGKRADWKKAYICLEPGQNFDLALNQK